MTSNAAGPQRLTRPQLTALRVVLTRLRAMASYAILVAQPARATRLIASHRSELPAQLRAHV